MRILYIHSTLQPPPTDLRTDRFFLLSDQLEGDVLQPIWFQTPQEVEARFGPGSYPVYTVGRFRYHWFLSPPLQGLRHRLATFWFYIRKGREVYRNNRFDCIVAYSHMTTGVLAGVLKLLTGAKLIIEIVTSPNLVYITHSPKPSLGERFMKFYSDICLHVSGFLADRAHFLYPKQLNLYPLLRNTPNSVFHEFVPVSHIKKDDSRELREKYVLLVGAPWYLKGADVLIKAFLLVAPDFPGVKLKILGYYPDQPALEALTEGSPQIEILKARPNPEALEIIKGATIMVMPSRCEGLSRALIEGMAAGLPLIGSRVGGIPVLIRDGENGFLIPVGDFQALAAALRRFLTDDGLRRRMGDLGYARAHGELNEVSYVREFVKIVDAAVKGDVGQVNKPAAD
jgi:glycosyltransferase involved in cell wall biosynthesis